MVVTVGDKVAQSAPKNPGWQSHVCIVIFVRVWSPLRLSRGIVLLVVNVEVASFWGGRVHCPLLEHLFGYLEIMV